MKVLLFLVLLVSGTLYGQNLSLFGLSNNSGVYASLNNPAEGSGANEWLSVNLLGVGSSLESNILRLDFDYSVLQMAAGIPKRQHAPAYTSPLYATRETVPKKPVVHIQAEILLPSFRINPHPDFSFFFITRDRVIGNLEDLGGDMIPLLMERKIPTLGQTPDLGMKLRMMGYREYAAGASTVLWKGRQSYFSGGLSIKRTLARFAYLMELADFAATPESGGAHISAQYRLVSTDLDALYQNPGDYLAANTSLGSGWSFDLGFIYEHRPYHRQHSYRIHNRKGKNKNFRQRTQVLYDYRIGIALTDLGHITYKGKGFSDNQYLYEGSLQSFAVPSDTHTLKDWMEASKVLSSSDSITLKLPGTLNFSFDYRISERWFVHLFYQQNLRNPKKIENLYRPSSLSCLLRRESDHFTFGIPLRLVPGSRSLSAGFLLQTGPFFLGTNNVLLLFSKNIYNVSVYSGFCFRIRYKRDATQENFKAFR